MTQDNKPAQQPAYTPLMPKLPEPMVQVYFVTIGGITHAMLGPVTHIPELGLEAGDLEHFEIGDVIPAELAARFMDGRWSGGVGGVGAEGSEDRGPGFWVRKMAD